MAEDHAFSAHLSGEILFNQLGLFFFRPAAPPVFLTILKVTSLNTQHKQFKILWFILTLLKQVTAGQTF